MKAATVAVQPVDGSSHGRRDIVAAEVVLVDAQHHVTRGVDDHVEPEVETRPRRGARGLRQDAPSPVSPSTIPAIDPCAARGRPATRSERPSMYALSLTEVPAHR